MNNSKTNNNNNNNRKNISSNSNSNNSSTPNNNLPKFLNKNYKSPSTEKLYTAIPKNLISNSKINKDIKKSSSLKIAPQFEQGKILFIKKQTDK